MTDAIMVAVLSLCGTLFGSIAGIITANRLTNYRIEELERKVEKHNTVVERVAILERDEQTQWKRLDEMRSVMEDIRKEVGI